MSQLWVVSQQAGVMPLGSSNEEYLSAVFFILIYWFQFLNQTFTDTSEALIEVKNSLSI